MKFVKEKIKKLGQSTLAYFTAPSKEQIQMTLFVIGAVLITVGTLKGAHAQSSFSDINLENSAYDDQRIQGALARIFRMLEGSFGALIMVCSGLGAILSSAFGQYRAALGCLVVAVGAFILRSITATFFNVGDIDLTGVDIGN